MRYSEQAVEALAAFLDANLQAGLTKIEQEDGLAPGALGAPISPVHRALLPLVSDPRDGVVAVHDLAGGPEEFKERSIFRFDLGVDFKLNAVDAQLETLEVRMRQWVSAFWFSLNRGSTNLGGTVNACMVSKVRPSKEFLLEGVMMASAQVIVLMQESAT